MSLDMRPISTCGNVRDSGRIYSESLCDVALKDALSHECSNFSNSKFIEYRQRMLATSYEPAASAAFRLPIPAVVRIGSEEEMCGVNARGIIAAVKHADATWDQVVLKFPREAMGSLRSCRLAQRDQSVSVFIGGGSPSPASTAWALSLSLINLRPEAFSEGRTWPLVKAMLVAVIALAQSYQIWRCVMGRAAGWAIDFNVRLGSSHEVHSPNPLVNRLVRLVRMFIPSVRAISILTQKERCFGICS